jgi:hypothetical protein
MVARMGMGGIGRVWLGGGSWLSVEERGGKERWDDREREKTCLGCSSRWSVRRFASLIDGAVVI